MAGHFTATPGTWTAAAGRSSTAWPAPARRPAMPQPRAGLSRAPRRCPPPGGARRSATVGQPLSSEADPAPVRLPRQHLPLADRRGGDARLVDEAGLEESRSTAPARGTGTSGTRPTSGRPRRPVRAGSSWRATPVRSTRDDLARLRPDRRDGRSNVRDLEAMAPDSQTREEGRLLRAFDRRGGGRTSTCPIPTTGARTGSRTCSTVEGLPRAARGAPRTRT